MTSLVRHVRRYVIDLAPGTRVRGPVLCALPEATLLVAPGWSGEVDEFGTVKLVAE